jgi:hypothetical protein
LRPISKVGSDACDIENDMRLFLDLVNWQSRLAPPDDERDTSVFQVYAGASALPFMRVQRPDRPRHRDDRPPRRAAIAWSAATTPVR